MIRVETLQTGQGFKAHDRHVLVVNPRTLGPAACTFAFAHRIFAAGVEEVGSTHALLRILVAETERPPDATPAPKAK
jgi:hypothetical protein